MGLEQCTIMVLLRQIKAIYCTNLVFKLVLTNLYGVTVVSLAHMLLFIYRYRSAFR